ncbi:MAG: HPr family phosphocarrier protein [Kiritimatiellae bacterium]|jgi:phosphocarrier protein HPr|nr:HPr family phosphocarrier protein [Kiritimatiellia bacterium]
MSADTPSKEFTINNEYGLHARPAALFVKCASEFDAEVMVVKDGMSVSGKSIMGLLTLEGHQGAILKIEATGAQAGEAIKALTELIESNFGE